MKLQFAIKPDVPNVNGIIFTSNAIQLAIENYKKLIDGNGAYGVNKYFDNHRMDLSKISFQITEISEVGNRLYGDIKILDTPEGNKLSTVITPSCKIGLSMIGELHDMTVSSMSIAYSTILTEDNHALEIKE